MKSKLKQKKPKTTEPKKEVRYSEELIREVKEAVKEYKTGRFFKGTADEVIKHLKDGADRNKNV